MPDGRPETTGPDVEAPEADVIEQQQALSDSPPRPDRVDVPLEASEADALDQAYPVELDDERRS